MASRLDALQGPSPGQVPYARYTSGAGVKRGVDLLGAFAGLLLLSPLFLLIMALVKFSDGGAVFYGHKRVGRSGAEFHCLKFRTMVRNGDEVLRAFLAVNPAARAEWEQTRKLRDDPRVTAVGTVLRKLSLDELPQLVNILLGTMSLVGPRPVVRDELRYYGSLSHIYLLSRPGLTGLWQISGRSDVSYDARVSFDCEYIENWSLLTDFAIMIKTLPAVCSSRGSY